MSDNYANSEADQLQAIRNAIYAIVNALGAALPMTPEVVAALDALVQSDHDACGGER